MNKQEFLAMSLPYGLKCKEVDLNEIFTLNPKLYSLIELLNWSNVYQPILRPLSDLTKPIEYKGEKFVPIVELVNLCYNNIFTTKPSIKEYETLFDDRSFGFIGYTDEERLSLTYVDYFNRNEFEFWISGNKMNIKQLVLFQKLIEWHFDIADLISKGEAIDVSTLETNPYK